MDPRDTPYKSNILEINEIDFEWVKKTDDKKLLKEAVKLLQNESFPDLKQEVDKKLCSLDPEYKILLDASKPPDPLATIEAKKQLAEFIKLTNENDLFEDPAKIKKRDSEQERFKGNEYLKIKEYTMAIKHYEKSLLLMPTTATYSNLSLAFLRTQNYDRCITAATSAIELDNKNFKAYFRRGEAYFAKKMYDSAYNNYLQSDQIESTEETKKAVLAAKEELEKIGKIVEGPPQEKEKYTRITIEEDEEEGKN